MLCLANACSSYHYTARTDPKAEFANYHTFAWLPHVDSLASGGDILDYDDDILAARVHDGVGKALRARGLTRNAQSPDILLQYHVGTKEVEQLVRSPMSTYYPAPYWSPAYISSYPRYYYYQQPFRVQNGFAVETVTNGRLAIDVIDRRTGKLVWRGVSAGEVPSPDKFDDQVSRIVENIFKKYP